MEKRSRLKEKRSRCLEAIEDVGKAAEELGSGDRGNWTCRSNGAEHVIADGGKAIDDLAGDQGCWKS